MRGHFTGVCVCRGECTQVHVSVRVLTPHCVPVQVAVLASPLFVCSPEGRCPRGCGVCASPVRGGLCEGGCPFCRPRPAAASLPPRPCRRLSSSTEQSTSSRLIRKHKRRRRKQRLRQTDRVGSGGVRGGVAPAPWPCWAPHPRPFAGLLLQQHHGLYHVPEYHHCHAQHG